MMMPKITSYLHLSYYLFPSPLLPSGWNFSVFWNRCVCVKPKEHGRHPSRNSLSFLSSYSFCLLTTFLSSSLVRCIFPLLLVHPISPVLSRSSVFPSLVVIPVSPLLLVFPVFQSLTLPCHNVRPVIPFLWVCCTVTVCLVLPVSFPDRPSCPHVLFLSSWLPIFSLPSCLLDPSRPSFPLLYKIDIHLHCQRRNPLFWRKTRVIPAIKSTDSYKAQLHTGLRRAPGILYGTPFLFNSYSQPDPHNLISV